MIDWQIVLKCSEYAAIAHKGQIRKDKITPYIVHLARASTLVATSKVASTESICATWMHDVIEDCSEDSLGFKVRNHTESFRAFLMENMPYNIAAKVISMVMDLTKHPDPDSTKDTINQKYYKHLAAYGDKDSAVIKFCDRIDNILTIEYFTVKGRDWYFRDTKQLIKIIGSQVRRTDENIYNLLLDTIEIKKKEFARYAG